MSRRDNSRNRRAIRNAFAVSAAQIAGMTPYSWAQADTYTVDGVSGKVASFPDKVAAGTGIRATDANHAFSQATSANQVVIPTVEPLLNGRLAARALGAETYVSTAAAAAWAMLQDGTGCEIFNVFIPRTDLASTHVICGTTSTGAAGGLTHYTTLAAAATAGVYAAGVVAVAGPGSAGNAALNTPTYTDLAHGNSASPNYQFRLKGTLGANGAYAAARDSTPQHTLRLWSNTPAPLYAIMDWAMTLTFARVLTAAERAVVQAYIRNTWGIAP